MNWIDIKTSGKPKTPCACWVIIRMQGLTHICRSHFVPWDEGLFLFTWGEPEEVTHYIIEPALP
jgi:hypothetical protein